MRATPILPGKLYQGPEFGNRPLQEKLSLIRDNRIDVVINVYKNPDVKLRERMYEYIYFPMSDGKTFNALELMDLAERAADLLRAGYVIYTHCHAGRNRSGFLNALIVRDYCNIPGHQALQHVRQMRPRAVDNEYFEWFLEEIDA